jgi:hypothetical protein
MKCIAAVKALLFAMVGYFAINDRRYEITVPRTRE